MDPSPSTTLSADGIFFRHRWFSGFFRKSRPGRCPIYSVEQASSLRGTKARRWVLLVPSRKGRFPFHGSHSFPLARGTFRRPELAYFPMGVRGLKNPAPNGRQPEGTPARRRDLFPPTGRPAFQSFSTPARAVRLASRPPSSIPSRGSRYGGGRRKGSGSRT